MTSKQELLDELLAKPIGSAAPRKRELDRDRDLTSELELNGNTLTATVVGAEGEVDESTAAAFLTEEGLDPLDWEVTGFRKSKWGDTDKPMESVRFTYRKAERSTSGEAVNLDDLLDALDGFTVPEQRPVGDYGFVVWIADPQFGKIDGDGVTGTAFRTKAGIDIAAQRIADYRKRFQIGHVHVGWLGDHIEGFVSQNGANAWRTPLALNEQLRLLRRLMLHSLKTFAPLAQKVTMAAVPGNHGEPIRFGGSGTTRYDDSHDTEALIAVADAAEMLPEQFGHVKFYVPDTDELIVVTEVANTVIAHHHGHKWKPGKHWDWWEGQAFNRESPMYVADVLVAGHLHHEDFQVEGGRTYWGLPALESDSTWFRHTTGKGGAPSVNIGIVKDGRVLVRETIYFDEGVCK